MLGTVTPLGERSRSGSFRRTAILFVVSSTAAAAMLGAALGLVGEAISSALGHGKSGPPPVAVAAVVLAALVVDATNRAGRLPHWRRQVSDHWLGKLRPGIYAIGFGAQLGVGIGTHLVSAATYGTFVLAALSGSALLGAAVVGSYGFVRGMLIYLGAPARDAQTLAQVHARVVSGEARWRARLRATEGALAIAAATVAFLSIT